MFQMRRGAGGQLVACPRAHSWRYLALGKPMLHRCTYHLMCLQPWLPARITGEHCVPAKSESPRVGCRHWKLSSSQVVSLCSRVKHLG